MPNSYTKLYIHLVFAPKSRFPINNNALRERLLSYMAGIITNLNSHLLAGFVMPDHVHLLISYNPTLAISEIAQKIKANSSKLINTEKLIQGKFSWNEGYAAFTVSQTKLDTVKHYINTQAEHHLKHKFYDEMVEFLKAHKLDFDNEGSFWNVDTKRIITDSKQ